MQLEPTATSATGHEQPASLGRAQQLTGVRAIGQRLGQARVDPWHHRRRGQHLDHLRCLVRQHLVQHVVLHQHVVLGAWPRRDRLRSTRTRGQRRQLQTGGPTIGALHGRLDAFRRQRRGQPGHQLDRLVR